MNLKKILLTTFSIVLSFFSFAQSLQVTQNGGIDTACLGDTAFRQILLKNTGNNVLTIDSIIAPAGFGRKGTYPLSISIASTSPNNFASIDFYHQGSALGLFTDTFLIYSNAANVPNPYKVGVSMRFVLKPVASFNVNDTDQCQSANSFVFTNTSTVSSGTLTYNWIFGSSGSDTAKNPTTSFSTSDTVTVLLIATSDLGCEGIKTRKIIVFPAPTTFISSTQTNSCFKNNSFTFTNGSVISSGTFTTKWYFGDGDSSTATNPTHSYAKDSSLYKLRLVNTSDKGCVTKDSQNIAVFPTPNVKFTINDSDQCVNTNSFTFTNGSTIKSGSLTHDWSFGDLTTSSATSPTKVYTTSGNRNVRLISTSDLGCTDTLTKPVIIYKKPVQGYTVSDSTQCLAGNIFTYTNTSTITAPDTNFYKWTFGDGSAVDTNTNTTHIYTTTGTFTAKLLVTSNYGCKDSISRTMDVYVQPKSVFTINDSDQCINTQSFSFTNSSTIPSGTISAYSWRFGNGDTSNAINPTKTDYNTADTLTVKLISRSNQGCNDTASKQIIVFPAPILSFGIVDTVLCFKNHHFVFNGNSTISSGTLTHLWQFGNGATSNSSDTTYSYPSYATLYPITYTVTSDHGCTKTGTDSVYLYESPVADFSVLDSAQCLRGNGFTFLNSSSISSGTITSLWKFGNGDTSSTTNPLYTYNFADTFNTSLIVTSNLGCKDTLIKQNILFAHPVAKFSVANPQQCFSGHQFYFRDTSTVSSGALTYNWDFGDATSSTIPYPSKTYTTSDTFDITFTVTSDQGCDSTVTGIVIVNPNPVAGFTTNDTTQCINGNQFLFTNTTTIASGSTIFNWEFGNGGTSSAVNAGIVYIATDTLLVKMTAISDKNCVDSAKQTVYVFPKPSIAFTVNDPTQCFDINSFDFTSSSSIEYGTINLDWDLADGNTSTAANLTHSYSTANTYVVRLTATSDQGCIDSLKRTLTVYPSPVVQFSIDTVSQCLDINHFNFTDNSFISSGSMVLNWSFGDLTFYSGTTPPTKVYDVADTFTVSLVGISVLGTCTDTVTQQVYVTPSPDASFTGLGKQYCLFGSPVTLTPTVTGGVFSGDNISGSDFTPAQPGWNVVEYAVTLNGCSDTAKDSTLVVIAPNFDLGLDTVLCAEDFFTLNVTTAGASYLWSDSSTRASYQIKTPGKHWVVVTNACATVVDTVTVGYLDFACDAFMPNAFTPEGNTVNDYFKPYIDTTIVKGMTFIVFSRWGNIIFETTDLQTLGWDGSYNGSPSPEGVYGYLVTMSILREDVRILKSIKGSFHLMR
jgi:gliding motility-associated-like protein